MSQNTDRPGDVRISGGASPPADAPRLQFIGRVRTENAIATTTPKNTTKARERGGRSTIEIADPFRPGLVGLDRYSHVIVLCWLDQARRDLIQITRPRVPVAVGHPTAQVQASTPTGVFALRSPVRPNPISLSTTKILSVDVAAGRIEVEALDLVDGTPVVDIKPYRPGVDAIPDAVVP